MAFVIRLYSNTSPSNKVDKTIAEVGYGTGVFRKGSSLYEPVIQFETALTSDLIKKTNYAYIEEFGRYYFITDLTSVVTGIWQISLHVDVLMTYKNEIRQQTAVVARQEKIYNMMLDDGWFMSYQDPKITYKNFSVHDPFETFSYVLTIAGS